MKNRFYFRDYLLILSAEPTMGPLIRQIVLLLLRLPGPVRETCRVLDSRPGNWCRLIILGHIQVYSLGSGYWSPSGASLQPRRSSKTRRRYDWPIGGSGGPTGWWTTGQTGTAEWENWSTFWSLWSSSDRGTSSWAVSSPLVLPWAMSAYETTFLLASIPQGAVQQGLQRQTKEIQFTRFITDEWPLLNIYKEQTAHRRLRPLGADYIGAAILVRCALLNSIICLTDIMRRQHV